MLQLSSGLAWRHNKMTRVLVSQNRQSIFEFALPDLTMGCQVATCRAMFHEIVLVKKALGSCVVTRRKVDLSKKEGIVGIV